MEPVRPSMINELLKILERARLLAAAIEDIYRKTEEACLHQEVPAQSQQKRLQAAKKELAEICKRIDIPQKYRNLLALSHLVYYIQSGRCEELGGIHGAYAVYEEELHQGITCTLKEINRKLLKLRTIKYEIPTV